MITDTTQPVDHWENHQETFIEEIVQVYISTGVAMKYLYNYVLGFELCPSQRYIKPQSGTCECDFI